MSPTQSPSPGVPGPIPARRRRLRAVFAADVANFGGMVTIDETKNSRRTLAHAQSGDRGTRNPRRLAVRTARRRHFRAVREHGGRGALRLAHPVPPGGIAETLCSQACASACIWARSCFRTSCPSARRWSSPRASKAWPNRAASWSRPRSWKRSPPASWPPSSRAASPRSSTARDGSRRSGCCLRRRRRARPPRALDRTVASQPARATELLRPDVADAPSLARMPRAAPLVVPDAPPAEAEPPPAVAAVSAPALAAPPPPPHAPMAVTAGPRRSEPRPARAGPHAPSRAGRQAARAPQGGREPGPGAAHADTGAGDSRGIASG